MGLGSTCRALPCLHLLHGKKIPVKGRSPYSSKSAIEIFSGNFSQCIYFHFWFSWYVTSCHIFNFRVILGSTFWFDDLVNNIETHHLDLFTNIDWTFELYTFHWNLRCQYFWKCDCPAYVYGRGGCLSNYEVGSASGCQVRRERMCVTCISVLVCFWMHSVQKWTRIGSIKCTRSTGPSSALYKTPADMFGPELLLSSLQFQQCSLRNPVS